MKKLILISLFMMTSNTVFADTISLAPMINVGGFTGPQVNSNHNVIEALSANDDSYVQLTGYVIKALGGEMYLFRDSTGEIPIEVDHDKWLGQNVSSEDEVQIIGEVDIDIMSKKIDVEVIRKL